MKLPGLYNIKSMNLNPQSVNSLLCLDLNYIRPNPYLVLNISGKFHIWEKAKNVGIHFFRSVAFNILLKYKIFKKWLLGTKAAVRRKVYFKEANRGICL